MNDSYYSFSARYDYKKAFKTAMQFTTIFLMTLLLIDLVQYNVLASAEAFKAYLSNGAFEDSPNKELTGPAYAVMQAVDIFLGQALPIMSILSITFILWSLISTVLYLFRQEFFDDVYLAKKQKRSEKSFLIKKLFSKERSSLFTSGAVSEFGFFKTYICPDLKSWAFFEASEGPMTVSDFFKQNFFKCVLMFAFCILISDRTMLDMFLAGASIGTYFFEKATYDYDYVEIIDGYVQSGSDYVPTFPDSTQGKNLSKIYNATYKVLKTHCKTTYTRGVDFKNAIGRNLESKVNGLPGADSDLDTLLQNKSFVVTAMGTQDTAIANNTVYDASSKKLVFSVGDITSGTKGFDNPEGDVVPNYVTVLITSSAEVNRSFVSKTIGSWTKGNLVDENGGTPKDVSQAVGTLSATWDIAAEIGGNAGTPASGTITAFIETTGGGRTSTQITFNGNNAPKVDNAPNGISITLNGSKLTFTSDAKNTKSYIKTISLQNTNNIKDTNNKNMTAMSRSFTYIDTPTSAKTP